MGQSEEAIARAFVEGMDAASWDGAQIERCVQRLTPDAHYHVYA
jgi:hypothetical protein